MQIGYHILTRLLGLAIAYNHSGPYQLKSHVIVGDTVNVFKILCL